MSSIANSPIINTKPDFSKVTWIEYGENEAIQGDLQAGIIISDLPKIRMALSLGATSDPRFLDETISSWKENNAKVRLCHRNELFSNEKFLPIVELLRESLPKVSKESLESLHSAFSFAFLEGRYKIVNFATERSSTESRYFFKGSEYATVRRLFPIIRNIYRERMYQCWVDAPTQPLNLSVRKFSINNNHSSNRSCEHYCKIILSNGEWIEKELDGKRIVGLIKAIPHSNCQLTNVRQKEHEPRVYYNHFNRYDSMDISPEFAKETLEALFKKPVQLSTNEEYFNLLRNGELNRHERNTLDQSYTESAQEKMVYLCFASVEQVVAQDKDSIPPEKLEKLENRLLRVSAILRQMQKGSLPFNILHLTKLVLPVLIFRQIGEILKKKNRREEDDFKSEEEFNNYLENQNVIRPPLLSDYLPSVYLKRGERGDIFQSLNLFLTDLTEYLIC